MSSLIFYEKDVIYSKEFNDLLDEKNPITVFNRITYIAKKYAKHNNLDARYIYSMIDILFIYYIENLKNKSKKGHFYEDMYLKMYQSLTPVLETFF